MTTITPDDYELDDLEPPATTGAAARDWMTRRYMLALSLIGLLAVGTFILFEQATGHAQNVSTAVSQLSRQQVMVERIALELEMMAVSEDAQDFAVSRASVIEALDNLQRLHSKTSHNISRYTDQSPLSQSLYRIYFASPTELNRKINGYISTTRNLTGLEESKFRFRMMISPNTMANAARDISLSLEEASLAYEREGERAVQSLRMLRLLSVVITVIILIIEAAIIFRPMAARVEDEINANQRATEALQQAADHLEEQVRHRTQQLDIARQEAEQANVAKSKFLAAAGHDLLQPLEAIGLFAGAIERRTDDPRSHSIVKDLRGAQLSMRRLLNSLLEMSQIEAGTIAPNPEPTDLAAIFDQLEAEFRPMTEDRDLAIIFMPTSYTIMVDRMLTERIIRNFVTNAVRYTPSGRVLVGCRRRGDKISIEVHDTGPGIADEDMDTIFGEFQQLSDPVRDKSEGLGLGLTIASRLAHMMDFKLDVKSNPPKGTCFSIEVPLAKPAV